VTESEIADVRRRVRQAITLWVASLEQTQGGDSPGEVNSDLESVGYELVDDLRSGTVNAEIFVAEALRATGAVVSALAHTQAVSPGEAWTMVMAIAIKKEEGTPG
jgi:hypothetical protein